MVIDLISFPATPLGTFPIPSSRATQVLVGTLTLLATWYAMTAVHEASHCLGAVGTGGRIERIELPLLGFSRTDVSGGRHPLVVAWAGPFFGATLPLVVLALPGSMSRRKMHVTRFLAGFCLLANRVYLDVGSFSGTGDCHDLVLLGCPVWTLVVFGFVSAAGGLFVLHGTGPLTEWFRNHGELKNAGDRVAGD